MDETTQLVIEWTEDNELVLSMWGPGIVNTVDLVLDCVETKEDRYPVTVGNLTHG